MAKPAFNRQKQREMTTAAEVGRKLSDLTKPSRCQESAVEAEGAVTGAILSAPYRCCDCGIRITAGRNSVTDGDECRCNRLRCPLARMSGLQCFNMAHNGHGINLYGVSMTLMAN